MAWTTHTASHYLPDPPPRCARCPFCDVFPDVKATLIWDAENFWGERMRHMWGHYVLGGKKLGQDGRKRSWEYGENESDNEDEGEREQEDEDKAEEAEKTEEAEDFKLDVANLTEHDRVPSPEEPTSRLYMDLSTDSPLEEGSLAEPNWSNDRDAQPSRGRSRRRARPRRMVDEKMDEGDERASECASEASQESAQEQTDRRLIADRVDDILARIGWDEALPPPPAPTSEEYRLDSEERARRWMKEQQLSFYSAQAPRLADNDASPAERMVRRQRAFEQLGLASPAHHAQDDADRIEILRDDGRPANIPIQIKPVEAVTVSIAHADAHTDPWQAMPDIFQRLEDERHDAHAGPRQRKMVLFSPRSSTLGAGSRMRGVGRSLRDKSRSWGEGCLRICC